MTPAQKRFVAATACVVLTIFGGMASPSFNTAHASEIKHIVNGNPITSYDIQRRAALIKLFRQKGSASEQMIEQTLKSSEMAKYGVRISKEQVNGAYSNFASSNKLKTAQLDQILNQAGVTAKHMKEFIRVQMGWSQVLGMRMRSSSGGGGMLTEQQMVRKVFELGGQKPSATEYMLQKITFVIPAKDRNAILGKRKREAEAFRQRFNGCDSSRQFAKGLIDVTVQDIPRVLGPELPTDWKKAIETGKPGSATPVRETATGVEFIGICSTREVNDDRAAQMVLNNDGKLDEKAEALSKKYLTELREKAAITNR